MGHSNSYYKKKTQAIQAFTRIQENGQICIPSITRKGKNESENKVNNKPRRIIKKKQR